jgi:hypothetical protein
MRSLATRRIVGLVIATAGVGTSIWCARDALRKNDEFHQWIDARPMETAIDVSQPGETTVPFHQTCSSSHGESLYLECDLDDEVRQNPEALLYDLSGSVVIRDSNSNNVESVEINGSMVQVSDRTILLATFNPFRKGEYVATVRVDSGATALAGKQQTMYSMYQLCGLEQFPALIAAACAFGAGATASFPRCVCYRG